MCRARVHTNGEEITKVMNVHSHPPDPAKISGNRIFSKLKQLSMDVGLSTHTVVANVCQDITPGISSVLPSISSLKRNVRRYRVCLETSLSNPSSLEDFIIPEKYLLTAGKKPFMFYDSGKEDPQRLLIFSTKENLELLTTCDHWYADGTFSSSRPLFSQIYTKQFNELFAVFRPSGMPSDGILSKRDLGGGISSGGILLAGFCPRLTTP